MRAACVRLTRRGAGAQAREMFGGIEDRVLRFHSLYHVSVRCGPGASLPTRARPRQRQTLLLLMRGVHTCVSAGRVTL